jgi:hypothetical protein
MRSRSGIANSFNIIRQSFGGGETREDTMRLWQQHVVGVGNRRGCRRGVRNGARPEDVPRTPSVWDLRPVAASLPIFGGSTYEGSGGAALTELF